MLTIFTTINTLLPSYFHTLKKGIKYLHADEFFLCDLNLLNPYIDSTTQKKICRKIIQQCYFYFAFPAKDVNDVDFMMNLILFYV